ncbi:hypothetical protein [Rhizobium sp. MHM7A]|uniref:hypothetical protein n=1 Tax=Rhizobium sp. MHM7A TaxID=2583233 RepID=UPI001105EDA6|nr:hypothetical protein [Rhizobium sp. MHM7A]TLX16202.1 hypothetical protein FFR93_02425 [Rhizobium sp. MHM7A]
MTEHNHRRGTKRKKYPNFHMVEEVIFAPGRSNHGETIKYVGYDGRLRNGYRPRNGKVYGYIDKSLHGWGRTSVLADKRLGASIPNDFTNGNRGMAKSVRGAKKFVRSRFRFHENAATRQLALETDVEPTDQSI